MNVEFIDPEHARLWVVGRDQSAQTWQAAYGPWPPDPAARATQVRGYQAGDTITDPEDLLDWLSDTARVAIPSEVTKLVTDPQARQSEELHQLWTRSMIGAHPWQVGTESQRWEGYLDPDLYDASIGEYVLRNKVGATNCDELRAREDQAVAIRLTTLRTQNIPETLDMDGLRAIHQHLFQDVYEWAGEPRTVVVNKGSGPFVHPHQLEATFEQVVTYLTDRDQLRSLPTEQYTASLARAYNAVNAIHAFREGNGRTQREFTNAIARQSGYSIDWTQIPGWLNDAACERGRSGDFGQLEDMFAKIMTRDPAVAQAVPGGAITQNLAAAETYLSTAQRPPAAAYQPPDLPPSRGVSSGPYRLGR